MMGNALNLSAEGRAVSSTPQPSAGLPTYGWQVQPLQPSAGKLNLPSLRLASSTQLPTPPQ